MDKFIMPLLVQIASFLFQRGFVALNEWRKRRKAVATGAQLIRSKRHSVKSLRTQFYICFSIVVITFLINTADETLLVIKYMASFVAAFIMWSAFEVSMEQLKDLNNDLPSDASQSA